MEPKAASPTEDATVAAPALMDTIRRVKKPRYAWSDEVGEDNEVGRLCPDGTFVECKFCLGKTGTPQRILCQGPFNATTWKTHKKSKNHMRTAGTVPPAIPARVAMTNGPSTTAANLLATAPLVPRPLVTQPSTDCPGIFYGQPAYLRLMAIYGEFEDLNITIALQGQDKATAHVAGCLHRSVRREMVTQSKRYKHACETCYLATQDKTAPYNAVQKFTYRTQRMAKVVEILEALQSPLNSVLARKTLTNALCLNKNVTPAYKELIQKCKVRLDLMNWAAKWSDALATQNMNLPPIFGQSGSAM
ncbi:hypothetical protein ACHHYP_00185 [Achlya hypogyna]|uniref:Uncharacterized protein n=1 Tax=Achlya hypogyna TaxID=1202772 RepID=A0A1V9ZB77_ACHHY|nr:hypothetical protein ACHHYP_00185 [Achlya hypogyna]